MSNLRSKRLLKELLAEQDNKCFYCGKSIYQYGDPKHTGHGPAHIASLEHLTKRADGGSWEMDNLAAACIKCNSLRGDVPWEVWKEIRSKVWVS